MRSRRLLVTGHQRICPVTGMPPAPAAGRSRRRHEYGGIEHGGLPVKDCILHCTPTGFHPTTPCPDLTDSAPFQRPPMLEGQHLGSDLEISVVVQECHIMGVG